MKERSRGGGIRSLEPGEQLRLALLALGGVGLAGTAGYMAIEGWGLLDALYMTVITLATVGYTEVHHLSPAGRVFTICLILGGVGSATAAIGIGTRVVLEGQLERVMGRRRMEKEIGRLRDHYIVCGYGRMGKVISREFLKKPVPFVVIEASAEVFRTIDDGVVAIQGNAADDEVLRRAGIDRAAGLVSVVSSDADNVYIVLTAAGIRPDLHIVARAGEEGSEKKLLRAGASRVVSPYAIGGNGIANAILRPAVVDFIELVTRREHLELQMEEVRVAEGSVLAGRTVLESGLRQSLGVIVVAVKDRGDGMVFNPAPDHRIGAGDRLIVLGAGDMLARLAKLAGG